MDNIYEDQLISFDTAKNIKKMGFPIDRSVKCFDENGNIIWSLAFIYRIQPDADIVKEYENYFPCPTQTTVQRWLREIHKIHCESQSYMDEYGNMLFEALCLYQWYDGPEEEHGLPKNIFNTYEKALEETFKDSYQAYLDFIILNKKETSKDFILDIG